MSFVHSQGAAGVSLVVYKSELGVALGIYNMLRFISGTFGVNILGIIVEAGRTGDTAPLYPFQISFYLLTAIAGVGFGLALLIATLIDCNRNSNSISLMKKEKTK